MIDLSPAVIVEFFLGLFLWWTGIYLFTQNPFNRITRISSALLATVSFYFSTDIFFDAAMKFGQAEAIGIVLKLFSWALYLPLIFLYHATLTLLPEKNKKKWQIASLYLGYIYALVLIILEASTNMMRNYTVFSSGNYNGNLAEATGPYFYIAGIYLVLIMAAVTFNFYQLTRSQEPKSLRWYKYFWPFLGTLCATLLGPIVLASYYEIIPHYTILPVINLALFVGPITYSIIRYNLFIDDAKVIFGRNFLFSTFAIFVILASYFVIYFMSGTPITSVNGMILPFTLAYVLIATHPIYEWVLTFARDIIYRVPSGYSVVTDEETARLIKDFNNPEKLEQSSLLRLNIINKLIKEKKAGTSVDALKVLLEEAIEYFKPKADLTHRTKRNLKYHLLKMIAYDESEEGQILWELGFDEYPVRVMLNSSKDRPPIFKSSSPADYSYISRNAYLALKREAIHDITWRISYLEKQTKRKLFYK